MAKSKYVCTTCEPPSILNENFAVLCLNCDLGEALEEIDGEYRFIGGRSEEAAKFTKCMGCLTFGIHANHQYIRFVDVKRQQAEANLKAKVAEKVSSVFEKDREVESAMADLSLCRSDFHRAMTSAVNASKMARSSAEFDNISGQIVEIAKAAERVRIDLLERLAEYDMHVTGCKDTLRGMGIIPENPIVFQDGRSTLCSTD